MEGISMKKKSIFIVIMSAFIVLLLSICVHAFDINASVEEQTYSGGASIKITSSEKMKTVKLYKKVENTKFVLFYIGKPNSNSFVYNVSNSKLSTEKELLIKNINDNQIKVDTLSSETLENNIK